MKKHIGTFSKEEIDQIISGKKTLEVRSSKKKLPPFGEVGVGDLVYLKIKGGDIKGKFLVKKIIFLEGVETSDFKKLSLGIKALDEQIKESTEIAQYTTVIFIGEIEQFVTSPISFEKGDRRAWIVLD